MIPWDTFKTPQDAITKQQLRILSNISINPRTGCWEWTAYKCKLGYGQMKYLGKMFKAHRVSFVLFVGPIPDGKELDHSCNNRGCVNPNHLRPCCRSENCHNSLLSKNNTSGFKGVRWNKRARKWVARISFERKLRHLGYFETPESAYAAYCSAAKKLFGEFANSGVPR